ncbi:MAG: hypothetical protein ACK47B_21845 [Armatimonadota bacterium]
MERDKLKETTRGRRPGGSRKASQSQETKVSDALGIAASVTLQGRSFPVVGGISFGDAKLIERRFDDLQTFILRLGGMELEPLGFFCWLMLRKGTPDLTEEQLDELLPVRQDELLPILGVLFEASGLIEKKSPESGTETETETEPTPSTGS